MSSKFCIHTLQSARIVELVQEAAGRGVTIKVVKSVGEIGVLGDVKAISPNTITVARFEREGATTLGPTDEGANGIERVQTEAQYQEFVDFLFYFVERELQVNPDSRNYVDYWEIMNEPSPPSVDGWRKLAELNKRLIARANSLGIKIGIFGLNLGEPEWDEMQAIVDTGVFQDAKDGGHILTIHEGAFGTDEIDKWYGDNPPIPGAPNMENAGALSGRYRVLYQGLLEPRDQVIPLVVSEAYFRHVLDSQSVVDALRWYDSLIRQDWYVLGATAFTLNPYVETEWGAQWIQHWPAVLDYMVSVEGEEDPEPPVAPTQPPIVPPYPPSEEAYFREYFPLNYDWYDVGNVQVRNGYNYEESTGRNPYTDGEVWNNTYKAPEGRHLAANDLPTHEHADFLNDQGYSFKLFADVKPFSVKFTKNQTMPAGKYRVTLDFFGDWYIWEGYKKRPQDKHTGIIDLYLGDAVKTFDSTQFDVLGQNTLTFEATIPESSGFGFGVTSSWAISNNGLFIKNLILEQLTTTPPVVAPPANYKVVYNLLPQNMEYNKYIQVAQQTYENRQTIGFSADDAGALVQRGTEDSEVVAWNPYAIGTGLTQSWFDENYPGATMTTRYI